MANELVTADGEIIEQGNLPDASLAIGLTRAEIDTQIATARAYPRSIQRATGNILTLATMDEATAEECNYALPRGGKPIQGPSIRLAEIVQQSWGNCRVAARVVHVDRTEKFVEAEGIYHDLETNSATAARVRRRIVDSKGRLYSDDMIIVTGNAACSIAKRNAILAGVPKSVWRQAYDAARRVVTGDIETLVVRRDKAVTAFANFGVTPERVFAALGVGGVDDINIDHIPILRGMFSALKNGEETVETMFSAKTTGSTHQVIKNPLADHPIPQNDATGNASNDAPANGPAAAPQGAEDAQPRQSAQKAAAAPAGNSPSVTTETAAADDIRGGGADNRPRSPEKSRLLFEAEAAADKGRRAYDAFWNSLEGFERGDLKEHSAALMARANRADGRA